ncbi:ABC transporter ATP-binding protein [Prochlorococcus marinus XMU1412]|uniref:ABC transporter ATP-binding protein n=1 Tax=Prochlorococcus marinus TaxID=1219 RepID=UPI001ADC2873|nr:ABC transporter ATP-binding protein [Prochlorococcus marinus]MBO8240572.1 ABC transporter ATP-binding protein [Prochlorococcus marinus XMU1412]MBW3071807.1 hypothetical protein [Prochlorococcus marinus str. MU1412]
MKIDITTSKQLRLLFYLIKEAGYKETLKFGLLIIYNYFLEIISLSIGIKILLNQNYRIDDLNQEYGIPLSITLIIIILSIRSFSRVFTINLQERIKCELANKFKEETLKNILKSDYENLRDIGRGSLHKIILINISKSISSIDQFLRLINQFICFLAYLFGLIFFKTYDVKLITIVLISSFTTLVIYNPNTWNLGQLINKHTGQLNKIIGNGLVGIKTIKSANSEEWLLNKFKRSNKNYKKLMLENIYRNNLFVCFKDIVVLISVGTWLILIRNDLDILSAGTSLLFCYKLSNAATNGIRNWRSCINGLPAYLELKEITSKIKKNKIKNNLPTKTSKILNEFISNKNQIISISWENKKNKKIKINKLSLNVGEITVISGISGVGKTRLIDTFIGLSDLKGSSWTIKLKNKNLKLNGYTESELLARELISYSPQDAMLIEASLKDNLLLGNSLNYRDKDILEYLRKMNLQHINNRNFGLNKEIDFSINPYSGGEIQKINILRSWLKDNPIEIYDEPTTFQDDKSVKNIIEKLKERSQNKMILIVSHDFRIIQIANKQLILNS